MPEQNDPSNSDPAPQQGGVVPFERPVDDPQPPEEGPVARQRERARRKIAYILLGVFVVELLFFAVAIFFPEKQYIRSQEYMQVALAGTFGLVGSVMGFYYGSQR